LGAQPPIQSFLAVPQALIFWCAKSAFRRIFRARDVSKPVSSVSTPCGQNSLGRVAYGIQRFFETIYSDIFRVQSDIFRVYPTFSGRNPQDSDKKHVVGNE